MVRSDEQPAAHKLSSARSEHKDCQFIQTSLSFQIQRQRN